MPSVQKNGKADNLRSPLPADQPPPSSTPEPTAPERPEADDNLPPIERSSASEIRVGAGGTLVVPREDFDADIDEGSELDLAAGLPQKIRKPGRREWIVLNLASELQTRMLVHKPKADGIEVEHYYVHPNLRAPIREDLKDVRVFTYYSVSAKAYSLWIVHVTLDNSWYESLASLLRRPADFFISNAIRVIADKENSRYRIMLKPMPAHVAWPDKSANELLGEALGPSRFITSSDHPLYVVLTEGSELV